MGTTVWCRRKSRPAPVASLSVWTLPTPRLEMGTGHWASPEFTGHYRAASAASEMVLGVP